MDAEGGSKGLHYEVVASNLRPELGKPYYAAVQVDLKDPSENGVVFYLKDLSDADSPVQTAKVKHQVRDVNSDLPLVIGGRAYEERHRWDGLIDAVRLLRGELPIEHALFVPDGEVPGSRVLADWRFEPHAGVLRDASESRTDLSASDFGARPNPRMAAWIDLCHVILNSNELLYVD